MKNRFTLAILTFVLALLAGPAPRADQVRLHSGKVIEGILSSAGGTDGKVRIWVGPAQVSLPVSQVASVTTDTLGLNMLIDAGHRLSGRRVEEGTEKLGQAAAQGAPPERIAALLAQHGDAVAEAVPRLGVAAREGLSQALAALDRLPPARLQELAPRRLFLHAALGESQQASALLKSLGEDYFKKNPAEKTRLAAMIEHTLDGWSKAEDFAPGEDAIALLRRIDPARAEGAAIQYYLYWGSVERRDGRYESALRIYTRQLMAVSPDIARDRILKALEEAERTTREKQHPMEAAQLYEAYGLNTVPDLARLRLAKIWHDEGWARLWENRLAEARQAFAQAVKYKPGCYDNCGAKDLAQCEWRERRAKLAPGDAKGHLDLGRWCEEQQLFEQAISELREAMRSPEHFAEADAKIQNIQARLAEAELARIMSVYEKADYGEALKQAREFMRHEYPTGFIAQAKQIADLSEEALKLRVAQRPQQAESLYQQAERAFYEEDYVRAQGLLATIAQHYADTVAGPRARTLSALVEQKLVVAALEGGRKPKRAAAATSATLAANRVTTGTRATVHNAIDDMSTTELLRLAKPPRPAIPRIPASFRAHPSAGSSAATPASTQSSTSASSHLRAASPLPGASETPTSAAQARHKSDDALTNAFRKMMHQEGINHGQP